MPNFKKEIIEYINKNKNYFEISKFDSDIFWFNQLAFKGVGRYYKSIFFLLFLKNQPKHYWLVFPIYSQRTFNIGARLYKQYLNNPRLLLKKFYLFRDRSEHRFEKFFATALNRPRAWKKLYFEFARSIGIYIRLVMFGLEALEKFLGKIIWDLIKNPKDREILTFPLYVSYIQRQHEELFKITELLPKKEFLLLKSGIKNMERYNQLKKQLKEYRKKLGWTFLNYASHQLPSFQEIFKIAISMARNFQGEKEQFKILKKKRAIKLAKLRKTSPMTKKTINLLDALLEIRDQRKAFWLKILLPFKNWLTKFAAIYGLSYEDACWLTWDEQCLLGQSQRSKFLKTIRGRKNNCIACYGLGKKDFIIFTKKDAMDIIEALFRKEKIKTLSGMPACNGKITGKIRIILGKAEIKKFKEGYILVASHTTPDYVSIMKKAKAILTERGGITSHAAIISRELGIPCVVGIRGLIGNLKDGDLVEVDADKGVVRILKSKT